MNWSKIYKIKLTIFLLCLSSICFCNDRAYDKLIGFAKEANFVEFKKQLSEILLTLKQKQELLNLVNEVIEKEYRYWRSYRPVIPETSVGKDVKNGIKIGYFLSGIFALITPIAFWFVLGNYFKGKKEFEQEYQDLPQNYNKYLTGSMLLYGTPNPATVASEAKRLSEKKECWLMDIGLQGFGACSSLVLSILLLAANQLNKKVLCSYKRWKKAIKIKHLIEPKMQGIWRLL